MKHIQWKLTVGRITALLMLAGGLTMTFQTGAVAEDELSSVFCPAEYNSSGLYDLDAGIHLRGGQLLKRFENKSIDEDRIFVK